MARFHSTMMNSRGNVTSSIGHRETRITTEGWHGQIIVRAWGDGDVDRFAVEIAPHSQGGAGRRQQIASGVLDAETYEPPRSCSGSSITGGPIRFTMVDDDDGAPDVGAPSRPSHEYGAPGIEAVRDEAEAPRHRDCQHFEPIGPRAGVTDGVCRYHTSIDPKSPRAQGHDIDVTVVGGQRCDDCPHFCYRESEVDNG